MQKNWRKSANFGRQSPFLGQKRAKMAYFGPFCQNQTFFGAPRNVSVGIIAKIILGISIVSLEVLVYKFSAPWDHSGPI